MTQLSRNIIVILCVIAIIGLSSVAYATVYSNKTISHLYANNNGQVLIKWSGSPRPGPCAAAGQTNYGWVSIPVAASDAQKALAIAAYLKGKRVRVDTSGCDGRYEKVWSIYSPGG